jgi:hypothetical protein
MLPASQTDNPPAPGAFLTFMVIAVGVVMLFTLVVGLALLSGALQPSTGNLLMTFPCLALFLWYGYGYGKETTRDGNTGLLLSLAGWALMAVVFFIRFSEATRIEAVLATGVPQHALQSDWSPAAWFFLLVALACLLPGAYLAWKGERS